MRRVVDNTTHIMGIAMDTNVLLQNTDQNVMQLTSKSVLVSLCFLVCLVDFFSKVSKISRF